jgi:uncharacterized membrane protein
VRSVEPRRLRNWAVVGTIGAAISAIVVAYPYFMTLATGRFGVRGVSAAALCVVGVSLLWSRRGPSPWQWAGVVRHGVGPTLAIPALLLMAALSGDALWMQLVPTLVYLTLADVFRASLNDGSSMIEMAAKFLVPQLPDFVGPYCRKVTIFWAFFFVGCAAVIAVLALLREPEAWALFTGQLIYWAMLAISAVEFCWRKTWFRYYPHMGPLDRLWSWAFPAENTEQGRRSEAYIRLHKPDRVLPS